MKLLTGSLAVASIEQQHTELTKKKIEELNKKQLMKLLNKLVSKTKGIEGAKFIGFCVGGSVEIPQPR